MGYKEIIKQAWTIAQTEDTLFKFGLIPAVYFTIVGVVYVTYQIIAFRHSPVFVKDAERIDWFAVARWVLDFMQAYPSWSAALIIATFLFLVSFLLVPTICEGAIIDLITKRELKKPMQGGVTKGLQTFFPLVEFTAMMKIFGFIPIALEAGFIMRNMERDMWPIFLTVLFVIFVLGVILNFLFAFSQQYIVLEGHNVINAIKRSTMLIITNVKDSFFLSLAMLIIVVRILINILLLIFVPLAFFAIVAFMTSLKIQIVGFVLGGVVGLAILAVAAYLLASFNVFSSALWTLTFIKFRREEMTHTNEGVV